MVTWVHSSDKIKWNEYFLFCFIYLFMSWYLETDSVSLPVVVVLQGRSPYIKGSFKHLFLWSLEQIEASSSIPGWLASVMCIRPSGSELPGQSRPHSHPSFFSFLFRHFCLIGFTIWWGKPLPTNCWPYFYPLHYLHPLIFGDAWTMSQNYMARKEKMGRNRQIPIFSSIKKEFSCHLITTLPNAMELKKIFTRKQKRNCKLGCRRPHATPPKA